MRGVLLVALVALTLPASVAASERVPITIRGKALTLEVYVPPTGTPRGTVLMGSGDVGWVGLAVDMAEFLSGQGYAVVGINVRQYLSAFTSRTSHLETEQIPSDFGAIVQAMQQRHTLWRPVIVSGVSEGAAIAVVAAAAAGSRDWARGVITMGLPPSAELAWHWSDFTAWITKKDANEPSFEPKRFVAAISPIPLWMIQSRTDEYVSEADFRLFERLAGRPSRLVIIDASNHRFTDRLPQLRQQFLAGLRWIQNPT